MYDNSDNHQERVYIHIGVAKAASTTLQKQLFDQHPAINYLGTYPTANLGNDSDFINHKSKYLTDPNLKKFHSNIVMLDEFEYHFSDNIEFFYNNIKPYLSKDHINLFSNERFLAGFRCCTDIKAKATRIKQLFPNAKIIIIIRNQLDIIVSQYRDLPFDPRCVSLGKPVNIDQWIEIAMENDYTNYFNCLKYYEVAKVYKEIFGIDAVEVFLFEDLVHQLDLFAEKLSDFIGIDSTQTKVLLQNKHENRPVSNRFNRYRMLRRKLPQIKLRNYMPDYIHEQVIKFMKKGKKRNYHISKTMNQSLTNYFGESNAQLQDNFSIELERYQYPMK